MTLAVAPESTRTLRLPRLTLNESRARALVARHGKGLLVDLGAPWSLDFQCLPLGEPAMVRSGAWVLQLEWAGARFVLRLPAGGLSRLLEVRTGEPGLQLGNLPAPLAADAVEHLWSRVASALAPLRRGVARLHSAALEDGSAPELQHRLLLTLAHADSGETFHAELGTDPLGLMLMAGALAARGAAGTPAEPPLRCRLDLGRTRLPAATLATLRPHDVVLFDEVGLLPDDGQDDAHRLWLSTGPDSGFGVRLHGETLEVLQPWKRLTMTSAPLGDTADAPDETVGLDAVPVQLSFDLGELTLPLAELQQLVPGQSFNLGRPLAGAVRVRANGALVGHGELVEIDGRLGVALTRIGRLDA